MGVELPGVQCRVVIDEEEGDERESSKLEKTGVGPLISSHESRSDASIVGELRVKVCMFYVCWYSDNYSISLKGLFIVA